MTNSQHPITPPPELVEQWINEPGGLSAVHVATQAARWGADRELEACCAAEHTVYGEQKANWLRSLRRPKPPSLAEQALKALDEMEGPFGSTTLDGCVLTLRAALERLQELEHNG